MYWILLLFVVSNRTSKKMFSRFLFSSWVKSRTVFFGKMSYSMFIYIYFKIKVPPMNLFRLIGLEYSPMVWETRVQSQVELYQRLKKWDLIPLCLTLSIIRWVSRVKKSNLREWFAPYPTPRCSSLQVTLDYGRQLIHLLLLHIFLAFKAVFRKLMIYLSVLFGFHSGDCFDRIVVLLVCMFLYHIYQPFRSGRIWHKVNF